MGLRYRKSINLGGGVRLNVGKKGVGLSAGTRGLRYSVNSSGRRTTSAGIPGTGLGYHRTRSSRSSARAAAAPPPKVKPGLMAPGYEKEFHKGLTAFRAGNSEQALGHFKNAAAKDAQGKAATDDLFAGFLTAMAGSDAEAIPYLESVVQSDVPLPDDLMLKYAPNGVALEMSITDRVTAQLEMGSLSAALLLVQCYQSTGRKDDAIGLLEQLLTETKDPVIVLSLCEAYAEGHEWDEIVALAAGTQNEDDLALEIRLFQAEALVAQDMPEAAIEAYRDALRSKKRDLSLLTAARYGRGKLLLAMGKKAQGRKDLAQVYADDPGFLDVANLLKDEDTS